MGYFAESFAELYNADGWIDMGMYIGAGSSMPGWYTVCLLYTSDAADE